jgi:large subunit ribosomal protein L9
VEVILLERIRNLGRLGETVTVKSGYGRNFLVPTGKAIYANAENIAQFEVRRAELEKVAQGHLDAANDRKKMLEGLKAFVIRAKSGDEGRLFGSIGTRDIANAFEAAGIEVSKNEIDLPSGPLRQLGEYEVVVELHSDVSALVKLTVIAEE